MACPSRVINRDNIRANMANCDTKEYKKLSIKLHPDKNPGCTDESSEKFKFLSNLQEECVKSGRSQSSKASASEAEARAR